MKSKTATAIFLLLLTMMVLGPAESRAQQIPRSIKLSWLDNLNPPGTVDGYWVFWSPAPTGQFPDTWKAAFTTQLSLVLTNFTITNYVSFTVCATNGYGLSNPSTPFLVVPPRAWPPTNLVMRVEYSIP